MKYVMLNDTHFGCHSDSEIYRDNFLKFFRETLLPYMKKNDIDRIIHLGDVFDNRKKIDNLTLNVMRSEFFDVLRDEGIQIDILVGNHDTRDNNTNEVNNPELLLCHYSNIKVYTEPTEIGKFLYVPWISKDNAERSTEALKKSKAEYVFGHFELNGFRLSRVQLCDHGLDPRILERFAGVFSGHFHSRQSKGDIHYLGTQCQLTWEDAGETKGFHVFDDVSGDLDFIINPHNLYETIEYGDDAPSPESLAGKIVRLNVGEIDSQTKLEKYILALESAGTHDVKVSERVIQISESITDEDIENLTAHEDTRSIIVDYVNTLENVDNQELTKFLLDVYDEALRMR